MADSSPIQPVCDEDPQKGQPFCIDLSTLHSDQINAILPFFQGEDFTIDPVTEVSGSCDTEKIIQGIGASLPFLDTTVTAIFSTKDDEASLKVVGLTSADWEFNNAFPPLAGSLIMDLDLEEGAIMTLDSFDQDEDSPEMIFDGTLLFTGNLFFLAFLMGSQPQKLEGPITMNGGQPQLSLSGPTSVAAQLGFMNPFEDLAMTIQTKAKQLAANGDFVTKSSFTISATLPFDIELNGADSTVDIPLSATILSSQNTIIFTAKIENLLLAGMNEISALADNSNLASLVPNQFFSLTQYVELFDLYVFLNWETPGFIQRVIMGVQNVEPWVFVSDAEGNSLLALETISLAFSWSQVNGTSLSFGGFVQVGKGELNVDAFLPDFDYGITLVEDSVINFEDVAAIFLDTDGVNIPDLRLTKYEQLGNPTTGAFGLDLNLKGSWPIGPSEMDLSVEFLSFIMKRKNTDAELIVSLKSLFGLGTFGFQVTADYPGSDEGWTFTGKTENGTQVPIGDLVSELGAKFGVFTLPEPVTGLTLFDIFTEFNTVSQNFKFVGSALFLVNGNSIAMGVLFDHTQLSTSDEAYETTFAGSVNISKKRFDLVFSTNPADTWFISAFSNQGGGLVTAKDLVSSLTDDPTLLALVPDGFSFDLKNALFAFDSGGDTTKFLLAMDMENGINLSNLPFVGQFFPADQTVTLAFQVILVGGKEFSKEEVGTLNGLLAPASITLPDDKLEVGFNLITNMRLGGPQLTLKLPVEIDESPNPSPSGLVSTDNGNGSDDSVTWWDLQKSFGPVTINRVGMAYADEQLGFFMDASLSFAGLTLSATGMGVSSPLTVIDPTFHIDGIGVDYKNGELEIGGALILDTSGEVDQYLGTAVISMPGFKLSATGAYAEFEGQPSLFIYAVLEIPLGGPPAFFVTGLSGGFGYNRRLVSPTIEQVKDFPFVSEAINGSANAGDPLAELQAISAWIPPEVGQNFFAVGIKFTSFKLVDSFALLTVSFGNRLEFQLMGVSSMVTPPMAGEVEPLAKVEMVMMATFLPEEGFLGVQAQLTDESYLLSKDCKLTGGFAFFLWGRGEFAGDFVVTLGGYHPQFKIPPHYPKVPRLGFNWKVDSTITIKGGCYYALTPGFLMAGGSLEASWKSGDFAATFNAGADFLIGFKPYHYSATIQVSIGASYTFTSFGTKKTVSTDVGAKLDLWGPDFGGKAKVKWSVVSFTVEFGSKKGQSADPISWTDFSQSFLSDGVLSLNARSGLQRTMDDGRWILDAKDFGIQFDSLVPMTQVKKQIGDDSFETISTPGADTQLGIGPMGIKLGDLTSTLQITFTGPSGDMGDFFQVLGLKKDVPGGMWGQDVLPSLQTNAFVRNALGGLEIVPMNGPDEGSNFAIAKDNLAIEPEVNEHPFSFADTETFDWNDQETVDETIVSPSVTTARNSLLTSLGIDTLIDLSNTTGDQFLTPPLVTEL